MRIILFGKNGQLGRELQQTLTGTGELLALGRDAVDGFCGDLSKPEAIRETILLFKPDVIFNAAAFTNVDLAETEVDEAFAINAKAPSVMAETSKEVGALLVHFSTDFVFDGNTQAAYSEDDATNPVNVYGESKLAGEIGIRNTGCTHLILRTSWVYSEHKTNFMKTILRLAHTRKELSVVSDQWGVPTSAKMIAKVATRLAFETLKEKALPQETYHLVPDGYTNRHAFAKWIVETAKKNNANLLLNQENITSIKSCDYPQKATRPMRAVLGNEKLKNTLKTTLIWDWKKDAEHELLELLKTPL